MNSENNTGTAPVSNILAMDANISEIIGKVSDTLGLSTEDWEKMQNNQLARLVAGLPFIAGCDNAERVALTHLLTIYLASNDWKKEFLHGESDNEGIFRRLERISHFDGGDPAVIRKGMLLLAAAMISDHKHDAVADMAFGKFNPLNAGDWNHDMMMQEIREEIKTIGDTELESYFEAETFYDAYWGAP